MEGHPQAIRATAADRLRRSLTFESLDEFQSIAFSVARRTWCQLDGSGESADEQGQRQRRRPDHGRASQEVKLATGAVLAEHFAIPGETPNEDEDNREQGAVDDLHADQQ